MVPRAALRSSILVFVALILGLGTAGIGQTSVAQPAGADTYVGSGQRMSNWPVSPQFKIAYTWCEEGGPGFCGTFAYNWYMIGSSDYNIWCSDLRPCSWYNQNIPDFYMVFPVHHQSMVVVNSKAAFDPAHARGITVVQETDRRYIEPVNRWPNGPDECIGSTLDFNFCGKWTAGFGQYLPPLRVPGTIQYGWNYSEDPLVKYAGGQNIAGWPPICNFSGGFCGG
ncbi:MAG: hypothetical protein ACR2GF_04695 [Acidimicrobiales bacterium]